MTTNSKPETGDTIYFVLRDGYWRQIENPNYWRNQGYTVLECYVTNATHGPAY